MSIVEMSYNVLTAVEAKNQLITNYAVEMNERYLTKVKINVQWTSKGMNQNGWEASEGGDLVIHCSEKKKKSPQNPPDWRTGLESSSLATILGELCLFLV